MSSLNKWVVLKVQHWNGIEPVSNAWAFSAMSLLLQKELSGDIKNKKLNKGSRLNLNLSTSVCSGLCRVHRPRLWRSSTEEHLLNGRSGHHHHQQQQWGQENTPGTRACVRVCVCSDTKCLWGFNIDFVPESWLSAVMPVKVEQEQL